MIFGKSKSSIEIEDLGAVCRDLRAEVRKLQEDHAMLLRHLKLVRVSQQAVDEYVADTDPRAAVARDRMQRMYEAQMNTAPNPLYACYFTGAKP